MCWVHSNELMCLNRNNSTYFLLGRIFPTVLNLIVFIHCILSAALQMTFTVAFGGCNCQLIDNLNLYFMYLTHNVQIQESTCSTLHFSTCQKEKIISVLFFLGCWCWVCCRGSVCLSRNMFPGKQVAQELSGFIGIHPLQLLKIK